MVNLAEIKMNYIVCKDLVKLAKKLKKEKVNMDIINIGEEDANTDLLNKFVG